MDDSKTFSLVCLTWELASHKVEPFSVNEANFLWVHQCLKQ